VTDGFQSATARLRGGIVGGSGLTGYRRTTATFGCMDEDEEYTSKSADAGRMGKAAEHLVAAFCILATRGELNVSTSLVDDERVDLVFHRRNFTARSLVRIV